MRPHCPSLNTLSALKKNGFKYIPTYTGRYIKNPWFGISFASQRYRNPIEGIKSNTLTTGAVRKHKHQQKNPETNYGFISRVPLESLYIKVLYFQTRLVRTLWHNGSATLSAIRAKSLFRSFHCCLTSSIWPESNEYLAVECRTSFCLAVAKKWLALLSANAFNSSGETSIECLINLSFYELYSNQINHSVSTTFKIWDKLSLKLIQKIPKNEPLIESRWGKKPTLKFQMYLFKQTLTHSTMLARPSGRVRSFILKINQCRIFKTKDKLSFQNTNKRTWWNIKSRHLIHNTNLSNYKIWYVSKIIYINIHNYLQQKNPRSWAQRSECLA